MNNHRLITPLSKGLHNGYNLFFFNGNANNDCFYYNFQNGTLSSKETLKKFFLEGYEKCHDLVVDRFIYICQNVISSYSKDADVSDSFFKQEQNPDDPLNFTPKNQTKVSDQATEISQKGEEENTKVINNMNLIADIIKDRNLKVAIYFDKFEWTSGLYASNLDGALEYIKCIQDLSLEKNAIVIVNISELELLKKYNFNLEESNSIYIGNPSAPEIKSTFLRKYMREYNLSDPIQLNLLSELDDISFALTSSNKTLRSSLNVYRRVMDNLPKKIVSKIDFEIAVEKIVDEKILFSDVILNDSTKNMIINSVDTFLNNDDSKNFRKGIILTGPPGTGKTFLAKALAVEKNCFFMAPTLSELKGEFVGQTSGKIKRIFEQARANQPTILFIDEADTVFVERGLNSASNDSFNLDMVNQFLVEIDGLTSGKQKIFIIAASNRVHTIDSAIRSRLSDPIVIPLPAKEQRKALFDVKLKKHKFSFIGKSFTEEITEKTANMSGRDIDNFVKILLETSSSRGMGTPSHWRNNETTRNLFFDVLKLRELSLINDMVQKIPLEIKLPNEIPNGYDRVIGYDDIKTSINRQLSAITMTAEQRLQAEKFGIQISKGILLYGPPGNSKTILAQAAAKENDLYFVRVLSKDFTASSIEQQLRNIQSIFDQVIQLSNMGNSPKGVLLFFDEIDALASREVLTTMVRGTLLDYLANENGVRSKFSKVVVMGATNFYELLDEAIIRKGRIDEHFYMDNPSLEQGKQILIIQNSLDNVVNDIDIDLIDVIYNRLLNSIREKEAAKALSYLQTNQEQVNILISVLLNLRPSGADLVNLYQNLKTEAYYQGVLSGEKITISSNIIDIVLSSNFPNLNELGSDIFNL